MTIPTCEPNCGFGTAHQEACNQRWMAYWRKTAQESHGNKDGA